LVATAAAFNWPSRTIHLAPDPDQSTPPVVTAVRAHRDGQWLATAGDDHIVRIFSLADGKQVQRLDKHTDWVRTVDFSPDGQHIASGGNDRRLFLWNAESGAWEKELAHCDQAITHLRYSHSGRLIAAACFESTIHLLEAPSGKIVHALPAPCADMRAVAFDPEDKLLAAGGRCGTIRLYDPASGEKIDDFRPHKQRIRALAVSQDGDYLASTGEDRTIHILPLADRAKPYTLDIRPVKFMSLIFYGPHHLAAAGSDNLVRLWDVKERQELGVLMGHTGTVAALDVLGKTLISAGYDTTVRIWTVADNVAEDIGKPAGRIGRAKTDSGKK
jgi:WD40 repeat protein